MHLMLATAPRWIRYGAVSWVVFTPGILMCSMASVLYVLAMSWHLCQCYLVHTDFLHCPVATAGNRARTGPRVLPLSG